MAIEDTDPWIEPWVGRARPARLATDDSGLEGASDRGTVSGEYPTGVRFEQACAAPERDRQMWAETIWRFVSRTSLVHGHYTPTPSPDHYLFRERGGVVFLGFGPLQRMSPRELHRARLLHAAAVHGSEREFVERVGALLQPRSCPIRELAITFTRLCFQPLLRRPSRISRTFAALLESMRQTVDVPCTRRDERCMGTADVLFVAQLQCAFYSVLARLDVAVDYADVERAFWPDVDAAIRTPCR
ncbi:MAG: hypothetical protein HYV09_23730 [Deltaproteobacteria bacterium]|nr:hypothetical protein [Deltaproteobacteria bacterium]